MTVGAVIFDFFGTLTPGTTDETWDRHAALSAAPLGIAAATWRRALDDSWDERATGRLGGLADTFRVLAARCGADPGPDALAAACAARRQCQRELFGLRADAEPTLRELRARGIPVGVLSDCSVELAEAWPSLPVATLVDARVLSCEEGRRKPDRELFLLAAGRLGAGPASCLYVGDGGGQELTAAASCGMTAYLFRADDWEHSAVHNRETAWPGPYLTTLPEVISLLELALP